MANKDSVSNKIAKLEQENKVLLEEIASLREQLFLQREELHEMHNARVLGRIIRVHRSIGNPRTLPFRTLRNTRKSIGKRTPDFVRIPVGRGVRIVQRAGVAARLILDKAFTKHATVDNEPWSTGPLISVIIPYYNRHDTIDATLRSLSSQTFTNFETILVDDGSTEEQSVIKLEELKKVCPIDIRIIHQENQGVAVARNNGIESAKGKYIVCLDSDDTLEPTYLEKSVIVLETNPDIALTTTYMNMFGVREEEYRPAKYNPVDLYKNNMVITAAMFRKNAWEVVGGYRSKIGYEDWEFWINLAKNGFWGKQIPEPLFNYRTALESRYIEDKDKHWNNVSAIRSIHSDYKRRIRRLARAKHYARTSVNADTALINLKNTKTYARPGNENPNVLVVIPCMTFGGAETLLYNFCRQTKDSYNVSFVTGLKSENQWEYKFREVSNRIYHLPNIFEDEDLYFEFISNYITTRKIDIIHVVHTDYMFPMMSAIKERHKDLKIVVTMFNDRVINYVAGVVENQKYIDIVTTDNEKTAKSFKTKLAKSMPIEVIPNGIDSENEFDSSHHNRADQRKELGLKDEDMSVFFIGRLSTEKNPDIFVKAAKKVIAKNGAENVKFCIIGDGPSRAHVDRLLRGVDESRIQYLGYQSDIARYLSAADVFVLPSSIEGFPLSILEAMAMKVAVVASNVGAIPDVIENGKNGYIIQPGSIDNIADVLMDLNSHRDVLESVKQAGRKDIETLYSHKQLGEHYRSLYKGVLR